MLVVVLLLFCVVLMCCRKQQLITSSIAVYCVLRKSRTIAADVHINTLHGLSKQNEPAETQHITPVYLNHNSLLQLIITHTIRLN